MARQELTAQEAIDREELSEHVALAFMSGLRPTAAMYEQANYLGLNLSKIQEAVDACYEEEDLL